MKRWTVTQIPKLWPSTVTSLRPSIRCLVMNSSKKSPQIGIGGCLLEILINYLENRKQFVRIDNCSSRTLDVTSKVPQGSVLGPLLFCILINDLPEFLNFSEPFISADDLKVLSIKKSYWEIQHDLDRVKEWVEKNIMELAMDKCTKITFRGNDRSFNILDQKLDHSKTVKDLGIHVSDNLTWKTHIEERLRKAKKCFTFSADTYKTRTVQVSHLASAVKQFRMCLCIKSRSPLTRKFPEEGSEVDNRE